MSLFRPDCYDLVGTQEHATSPGVPCLLLCGQSFCVGDVLKVECSDDTEKIVCVEQITNDGRCRSWDLFAQASWEGIQGLSFVELNDKNIRSARKVGHIAPEKRNEYVEFAIMYRRFRAWEKLVPQAF